MNTQPVRDNANVFQSFNSYAKAVLGNKSVGVSGNNDASNSGEKPVGVSKLGGRWGCSVFTDMVNDGPLSHGKVCVLIESLHRVLESLKVSYRNRSYCITATEFAYWASNIESTEDKSMIDSLERKDDEGPSLDGGSEHEEPLDVDNCDSVSSKDDNNDLDSSSEMSSTSRLMREVDVPGVDSDHVDSFEECEIIGDSVLNNDGCVKDYMEKNLDDDVEKDIEDCSKNVTEKCVVVNNNMSNNVKGEILEGHFDGDRRNDTIEDNVDVNPSTNVYLDVNQNTSIPKVVEDFSSLDRNKCQVRPVKAVVNDSSIVSPSTPPGTVLNLAEESCSTWLDYLALLNVSSLVEAHLDYSVDWSEISHEELLRGLLESLKHVKDITVGEEVGEVTNLEENLEWFKIDQAVINSKAAKQHALLQETIERNKVEADQQFAEIMNGIKALQPPTTLPTTVPRFEEKGGESYTSSKEVKDNHFISDDVTKVTDEYGGKHVPQTDCMLKDSDKNDIGTYIGVPKPANSQDQSRLQEKDVSSQGPRKQHMGGHIFWARLQLTVGFELRAFEGFNCDLRKEEERITWNPGINHHPSERKGNHGLNSFIKSIMNNNHVSQHFRPNDDQHKRRGVQRRVWDPGITRGYNLKQHLEDKVVYFRAG
nr:purine permease [Tanacetum cinerariifolium]